MAIMISVDSSTRDHYLDELQRELSEAIADPEVCRKIAEGVSNLAREEAALFIANKEIGRL